MADSEKVKVAVRVRPFNRREVELGTKNVVDMNKEQTILYHPSTGVKDSAENVGNTKKMPKTFAFDHCFWSIEENNPKFAGQEDVFNLLGKDLLGRAFEGYNACIFAYGQTGSGKSYTMMGTQQQKGIIPRLCDSLFESIAAETTPELTFKVEVSYMEIYNEKVRDLLDPQGSKHTLRVREHNILGPYVDGLSCLAVGSFQDIDALMSEGNKSRTVAATNMNNESSRSHAVFNIILNQTLTDTSSGVTGEKVSKMSLVDLAGSERAQKTGAVGERLKEGSNINKSLTTLGLVISALADQGNKKSKFVPYRDSVLTWLLKDNLGGNSKTVMVATLSPSADNYEETLSTLRYADRAKRIVNHAVVNEDPNARIIRELREEVEELRKMLTEAKNLRAPDLQERLEVSEKLMKEMGKSWEDKLKETEKIHAERHAALERMGISVQTSGIKVEHNKYYLVNLNADPSLNELLVYYLKENQTLVGRPDAPTTQDIQLSGLGIQPQHCAINIEDNDVYLTPLDDARTCVNGRTIDCKTKVKNGDRILWGNNHFFRINCPKANSPTAETPDQNIDYDFAQNELMMQQMGNDSIKEAISAIEKQHEDDKVEALEKQKQMYERQMQMLRNQLMSPSTPSQPYTPFFGMTPTGTMPMGVPFTGTAANNANIHPKYQQWASEREKLFKQSLVKLKEEVVKANTMVREANFLSQEMGKETEFHVTLQIPAANLSPNRKRGAFVSEPAILVRRKAKGAQIWSMDKFENKIIDMRELYEECKEKGLPMMDQGPPKKGDPFYELQENHNLIGVANVFLEALFYDVKLNYHVPIISQQGEVSGRLHIEICRLAGSLPDRNFESNREDSMVSSLGSNIVCRVSIKEARGLPPALSHFVFCQYTFWGHPDPIAVPPVVGPDVNSAHHKPSDGMAFKFDHKKEFTVRITEEFLEHCAEGALSIEVWGHRSIGAGNLPGWEIEQVQAKSLSIKDRWNELTRKIELWVEIHELNDQGEYMPVEVKSEPDLLTGGVHQLRQGHSRRILVKVNPVQNSGTLPIICEAINHISIGCVCARSKLQKGLDSYQEEDLGRLREKWSEALSKRRDYLDEQLQMIMNKEDKSETDVEREKSLVDQWVCLTEERNAVLVPAAGSGIPGAPADWVPPSGMEQHVPVIFLDLNADDMSTPNPKEGLQASGVNSILPKEHGANFFTLPFVKNSDKDVLAVVSWDSSIHDSVHLNRLTPANERVYLILKVVVRLSHPAAMELVLRKRIAINVYKRQSITGILKKRIGKSVLPSLTGYEYFQDSLCSSAVMYEIVSNIPKASEDLEDRESLAQMAASHNEAMTEDGETYIEKYIKGVSAVESILTLDRLRQEVAIKELLSAKGRPLKKSTSVPNIQSVSSPMAVAEPIRSDSINDLSTHSSERYTGPPKPFGFDPLNRNPDSTKDPVYSRDSAILPNKPSSPFNLASQKSGASPQPSKVVKPMKTLMEEQQSKPLLRHESDSDDEFAELKAQMEAEKRVKEANERAALESKMEKVSPVKSDVSDEFQEFESYKPDDATSSLQQGNISHSNTNDSIDTAVSKVDSSGYSSQALSSQTLSSEDSGSARSLEDGADGEGNRKVAQRPTTLDRHAEDEDRRTAIRNCMSANNKTLPVEQKTTKETETAVLEKSDVPTDKPGLKRDESLIDMKIPEDLGSPLKPTTPKSSQHSTESTSEPSGDGQTSEQHVGDQEDTKVHDQLNETLDSTILDDSYEDETDIKPNGSMDIYSMDAMDELEALGEDEGSHEESRDHFDDRLSEDESKVARRRSWHEKTEKEDVENVKLRRGGSIDVPRTPSSFRTKGGKASKASPSPVKATYRPMSMPVDNLVGDENGHHTPEEGSDNEDSASSFGSRADLHRLGEGPLPSWIVCGEPVIVLFSTGGSKTGVVHFVGPTEFASGTWVGVELDQPEGKNNGTVKGVKYFKCKNRHGIFVRHDKLIMDKKRRSSSKLKTPAGLRRSSEKLSSASSKDVPAFMRSTAASSAKKT